MTLLSHRNRSRWCRAVALILGITGAAVAFGPTLAAQQTTRQDARTVEIRREQRADDTRNQLRQVMEQYPPALGRILRLDPSLMANPSYLAPYPELAAFLEAHPDVPRDAEYFFAYAGESHEGRSSDPLQAARGRALELWQDVLTGVMALTIFFTLVLTLTWLIRYFVSHRRWLRAVQIQSDLHGRVMERLGSSDELLTYVQSAAGRQLLHAPSAPEAPAAASPAAPFGRILWAIQSALVLASGGAGLLIIKPYVIEEVAQMLLVLGVLAIALGVGFGLAAAASYMLAARLGLLDSTRATGRQSA